MSDPIVAKLQDWLNSNQQALLDDTVKMLQFPSLEEAALPNAPFGQANRDALDFGISICKSWGWNTKDGEGYYGYGEFGKGKKLILVLGHLDVVPTGPGWKHAPFGAEIDEGYIYARGAEDDKGPTMAALYAARALEQTFPDLDARVRVVFGCNEESGMECVKKYGEREEHPTFGLAPDSGWPCYHAEKGIADLFITVPLGESEYQILEASGGQRRNIVPDYAMARVKVAASQKKLVEQKLADAWDKNVAWSWESGEVLKVEAAGKAAHGSTPFSGDSAVTRLFRFLYETSPLSTESYYAALLYASHPSGVGLGIHDRDDVSKDLTSNLGVLSSESGLLHLLVNVRYPVTWQGDTLLSRCQEFCAESPHGFKVTEFVDSASLYFPVDSPLVKAICEVYKLETGEDRRPGVMGGGTYARMLPNTISIGTGWEGDGKAHETDERLKVEHLYKMSRIYAHILYRLATI
ncbi:MAG: Sapep family Mn(2+)-dependent dipeptidase [Fimbriimonadaceae bacterium]|nr:Sapep family Mn(2+)-dependent dipeptidase [Fimbriimonadaceae bacterium]